MKSTISATHLVRVYALFTLVVLFLLTMARAGFSLWQLARVESVEGFDQLQGFASLFVTGWRYDLALIGAILLIPVTLGTLLAMIKPFRAIARFIILLFLVLGLIFVLLGEYITPYFLHFNELRPDLGALQAIDDPVTALASLWSSQMIPAVIGLVLGLLILIAFIMRLETSRFLRFPIAPLSGLTLIVVGGALCVLAMVSSIDFVKPPFKMPLPLHPTQSVITEDTLVNELTLNSAYKMGWSLVPMAIEAK